MPSELTDSSLFSLFMAAITAALGIFLVIVPAGILSALLMIGVLQLGHRARIQRKALVEYFRLSKAHVSNSNDKTRAQDLEQFLRKKYGDDGKSYAERLLRLETNTQLVPTLAQMDAENLYALHYRQISGQLMTVVNNEAMQGSDRVVFTPLIDVLTFLATRRSAALRATTTPDAQSSSNTLSPSHQDARVVVDLALREIDGIQATLGKSIGKSTFLYSFVVWSALFASAFISTTVQAPLLNPSSGLESFFAILSFLGAIVVAVLLALALSLGVAVFGAVVFSWLDRFLASK